MAAGTLAVGSTDAVNGGQLLTANERVAAAFGGGAGLDVSGELHRAELPHPGHDLQRRRQRLQRGQHPAQCDPSGFSTYFKANSTRPAAQATGTNALAMGSNAQGSGANAIAIGNQFAGDAIRIDRHGHERGLDRSQRHRHRHQRARQRLGRGRQCRLRHQRRRGIRRFRRRHWRRRQRVVRNCDRQFGETPPRRMP